MHMSGGLKLRSLSTAVAVAALAGFASTSSAAPAAARVTLEIERFYDDDCFCYYLRFRGVVSPPARNEYVAVMLRECGLSFATSVAGASTRANGSWVAKSTVASNSSATYWARWGGRLSKPVTVRPQMSIRLTKLGAKRYRVTVNKGEVRQKMVGRFVELQRLAAGSWTRVRRARLAADPGAFGSFSATFVVRTRGLRMRIAVPDKSAAPCFATTLSQTFVS
jgi:hypothetical protein